MNKLKLSSIILFSALCSFARKPLNGKNTEPTKTGHTSNSICFIENKGQVVDQNYNQREDIIFYGENAGLTYFLRQNGISYQLSEVNSWKHEKNPKTKQIHQLVDKQTIYRIDINWLNAVIKPQIKSGKRIEGSLNYYTEGCPVGGALDVNSYEDITYQNLYSGVDLKWYQKNGVLKYDYLCNAGSDYKQIQLVVNGAESLHVNNVNGELIIKTPLGIIIEKAPLVVQAGRELKSKWVISKNVVSFEIENLNKSLPYIIDPVVRLWDTFYGGSSGDESWSCTTDASGNVFMAGYTFSNLGNVIATTGAHQTTFGGGVYNAFLVKFNSNGVRQWATYYGGSGEEYVWSCATDAIGNIYIAGHSLSTTNSVIATAASHQSVSAGSNDAFIVKFNTAGVRQWATFYGGTADDYAYSVATDVTGNVYFTGYTESTSNIATPGAHQTIFGGVRDALLVKFNNSGVRQWATYYGGNDTEFGYFCGADASGNVILTGYTSSTTTTLLATSGSHQPAYGGGSDDGYLVKFNSSGVRLWGTYYGGGNSDYTNSSAIDASGNIYIAGYTESGTGTVIATAAAHQTLVGGNGDAYLAKFNGSGARQWGTYYGDTGFEQGYSTVLDPSGSVYLAGSSASVSVAGTVIATLGSHQSNNNGGAFDGFLAKFNNAGIRQWGTFYGGNGFDYITGCNTDINGSIFATGVATSTTGTGIGTSNSHQSTFGGGNSNDGFLVKFRDCAPLNLVASVNATTCIGGTLNFTATITGTNSPSYSWFGPNTFTSTNQNPSITNASTLNVGVYTITTNDNGCTETSTTQVNGVLLCTKINGHSLQNDFFQLYPNPSNGIFNIDIQTSTSLSLTTIEVTDVLGRVVLTDKVNAGNYQLNLGNNVNGVYFVKATIDGKTKTVKVVKE